MVSLAFEGRKKINSAILFFAKVIFYTLIINTCSRKKNHPTDKNNVKNCHVRFIRVLLRYDFGFQTPDFAVGVFTCVV